MGMGAAGIKTFAVTVLVLGLVVEQHIQVQAIDYCCSLPGSQAAFDKCAAELGSLFEFCVWASGCLYGKCRSTSHISHLQSLYSDSTDVAAANVAPVEFCKSGCTSSVCDSLKTAVVGNKVDEAKDVVVVNRCAQACSRFCTKHFVVGNAATNDVV